MNRNRFVAIVANRFPFLAKIPSTQREFGYSLRTPMEAAGGSRESAAATGVLDSLRAREPRNRGLDGSGNTTDVFPFPAAREEKSSTRRRQNRTFHVLSFPRERALCERAIPRSVYRRAGFVASSPPPYPSCPLPPRPSKSKGGAFKGGDNANALLFTIRSSKAVLSIPNRSRIPAREKGKEKREVRVAQRIGN